LPLVKDRIERFRRFLSDEIHHPKASSIFFRALVVYTLGKVVFLWKVTSVIVDIHTLPFPRSFIGRVLLAPAGLAYEYLNPFYVMAIAFLIAAFFFERYYWVRLLFFYLAFNLYVINLPIANGSDMLLFMMGLWCIPTGRSPMVQKQFWDDAQKIGYNVGLTLCQLQVVNVYLISGLDKLSSEAWQSGEAFEYIKHLELFYNPMLPDFFDNQFWNTVFSWSTISFELCFVGLVWFERTRRPILALGIIFNLFIWVVLSLPDFALIMMVSLLIFMKDEDYQAWPFKVRQSLP
jgi:hypothetical protein